MAGGGQGGLAEALQDAVEDFSENPAAATLLGIGLALLGGARGGMGGGEE
jgi:hypothetical protein